MTLLRLLINIMQAINSDRLWSLINVTENDQDYAHRRVIRVSRETNSADYAVDGEYDIEYIKGDEHIHMTWSDEAFRLGSRYVECDFSDMYSELKTFEASTGVDLLSEDWMLDKNDFKRVQTRVNTLVETLYDPKEGKDV